MAIYDINGNLISSGGVSVNDVKTALIDGVASGDIAISSGVGVTLSYNSPGTEWETNAETAYNNMLMAYKSTSKAGIPLFICTDQHNTGLEPMRWLNNFDNRANGMEVIAVNLGDTCNSAFNETTLGSMYERTWQVKNYIGVPGNHDIIEGNYYDINRWFMSTHKRESCDGEMPCYTVKDGEHGVKYLCIGNYIIKDDGTYEKGLDTDAARWIIDELSRNDGYDIVYLQHWPMYKSRRARGEETESVIETAKENANPTSENYKLWQLLLARKSKQSGVYVDTDGVSHSFDFTGCKNDLLIALHGHDHAELMSTVDGLTAYAADRKDSSTNRCTFALVDRMNRKATFWVFDSTGCLDPLELPI